ncbi:MAG TPA: hypothetical protein VN428_12320 [Bryobacteraceae bacterium]|nr:hypothetical protein [Bryobacteraceae bacterium]
MVRSALLVLTLSAAAAAAQHPYASARPVTEAALFEPLSTPDYDLNATFTPDGRTVYFTRSTPNFQHWTIVVSHFREGKWTQPEVAPFSGVYDDADPFLAPDGKRLFYISNRPLDGKPKREHDIWMVERNASGWSEPANLGSNVNSPGTDYYPSVTADGTLYFTSIRKEGKGGMDLYRSRVLDGVYQPAESLGDVINTPVSEGDAVIAPDESFMVFTSFGRPDDTGRGDLYISELRDGTWTVPRNLGPKVNSVARDFCPTLSPDGKYLFFTSERNALDARRTEPLNYAALMRALRSVMNGNGETSIT